MTAEAVEALAESLECIAWAIVLLAAVWFLKDR